MINLLKIKHWQVFLIWIIGALQMQFFMNTEYGFFSIMVFLLLIFGWIYSIAAGLNKKNIAIRKRINVLSIIYLISIIPTIMEIYYTFRGSIGRINPFLQAFSGLIGMVCIIYIMLISAKSLKKIEKQDVSSLKDYLIELILIFYMIIGVWIIQPKLNKIASERKKHYR